MYTTIPSSVCHACMVVTYIRFNVRYTNHAPSKHTSCMYLISGVHKQHAHYGGKERRYMTGYGPMDVWQERGTGRGFEMERHGDWTDLTGMGG